MSKVEAFQQMCLSIATIRTIREGLSYETGAYILNESLKVNEWDLRNTDPDLYSYADEFVDYFIAEIRRDMTWLPNDWKTRRIYWGGEQDV